MPGCTVPSCTNSSQKGFRLYHFPSDEERCLLWVQNLGRGDGWTPTKHTCVCEVHFEESQFESHRADGLRKLKPNAVPTLFDVRTPLRTYGRKPKKTADEKSQLESAQLIVLDEQLNQTSQSAELQEPAKKRYRKQEFTKNELFEASDLEDDPEPLQQAAEALAKNSPRGRKRGRPPAGRLVDDGEEWLPSKGRTSRGKKRGRPQVGRKGRSDEVMEEVKSSASQAVVTEGSTEGQESPRQERQGAAVVDKFRCYVCDKWSEGPATPLDTLTDTSKLHMWEKLDKLSGGGLGLSKDKEGETLCPRCTRLLNYVDRIEMELGMLSRAIISCLRKRGGGGAEVEQEAPAVEEEAVEEKEAEPQPEASKEDEAPADDQERYQCRVCKFRTRYKSVHIFHLRQHLRDTYRCDFCCSALPPAGPPGGPSVEEMMQQLHSEPGVLVAMVGLEDNNTPAPTTESPPAEILGLADPAPPRHIRVLNEMGMIVLEEAPNNTQDGTINMSDTVVAVVVSDAS